MKKLIALAICSTLMLTSLAACSNSSKETTKETTDVSKETKGTTESVAESIPETTNISTESVDVSNLKVDIELTGKDSIYVANNNYALLAGNYLELIGNNLMGPEKKESLKSFIIAELINAGYLESQIEVTSVGNIVLTVPGSDTTSQVIIGGHYDGEGIGDNASGAALILATAVGLSNETAKYNTKYVFFDQEEAGLVGSFNYAKNMSQEEIDSTKFMVNIDSIAFGDYANIYGGTIDNVTGEVSNTQYYEKTMEYASDLGFNIYTTYDLDGYYEKHGTGPDLDPIGVFTNPWTEKNPAPSGFNEAFSPATIPASDHVGFNALGIPYIYFEATNWFAKGTTDFYAYSGYYETYDTSIGESGMFMNTEYDTLENLEKYFPGRAMEHFNIYSPILSKLILEG